MAATITTNLATTTSFASIADFKATCPSIGLADSQIVAETTTYIVYKITNGSGTYADLYLRFANNSVQAGTGWDATNNVLTGAGTGRTGPQISGDHYTRSFLTSDGTVGLYQQISTATGYVTKVWGYIKPTNTTLTPATIPLTQGIGLGGAYIPSGYVGQYLNNAGSYLFYNNYSNLIYAESTQRYGSINDTQINYNGAISTGTTSSYSYWANPPMSAVFNLQKTEAGNQGVMPNVPIFSGGRCIGYNSNLAFCSPELIPGDRIVVSQGTEEYVVIGANGIALRQI